MLKTTLLTLLLSGIALATTISSKLNEVSSLDAIIKSNHFECFKEKDTAEVYRKFRLFYENEMTECKEATATAVDFKAILALAKSCRTHCTCSVILDYADSEKLNKTQQSQLMQLVGLEASQMKTKDYEACFKTKLNCNLPIVKRFNEAKWE